MTLFYFSGKRENGDVVPGSYKTYDSEKHFKYVDDDDRYNLIAFRNSVLISDGSNVIITTVTVDI